MRTERCLAGLTRAWPVLLCTLLAGCGPLSENGSSGATPQPDSLDELLAARGLALDAVTPAVGPTTGGIQLAITGSGFEPGAQVTIAGEPATQVIVLSGTRMILTLPEKPGAWGKVPVVVQNPSGSEVARSNLFGYHASYLQFPTPFIRKESDASSFATLDKIQLGDFNGDQRIDALFSNRNRMTIALGDGRGNFGPSQSFVDDAGVRGPAVGDFNRDGKLDVAYGNSWGLVVRLGDGARGLREPTTFLAPGGHYVVGDLNGDHKPDLLTGGATVLLGDGAGAFFPAATTTSLPVATLRSRAVADFNEDGKLDLIIGLSTSPNSVAVLLGDGSGGFGAPSLIPMEGTSLYGIHAIAIGDFNGDKRVDFATVAYSPRELRVFLGNGLGAFGSPVLTTWSGAYSADDLGLASIDLNGDQKDDLVVITGVEPDGTRLFLSNGSGGFDPGQTLDIGGRPVALSVGDLTRDGRPDVVVLRGAGAAVLIHDGAQGVLAPQPAGSAPALTPPLAVADFDGDKLLDRLVPSGTSMSVHFATRTGEYVPGPLVPWDTSIPVFEAADINGDGKPDLVGGNSATLTVQLGDGTGRFDAARSHPLTAGEQFVGLAEFNRDGRLDIVHFSNSSATLFVRLADGTGGFSAPNGFLAGGSSQFPLLGDFNEDGVTDVVTTDSGSARARYGDGRGGFSTPVMLASGYAVAVADWNGDGHLDLALQNFAPLPPFQILLGDGTGKFSEGSTWRESDSSTIAPWIVSDFNGDELPDLAKRDSSTRSITVLLGDRKAGFRAPMEFWTHTYGSCRVADVDADRRPDFVCGSQVLLNLSR